MQAQPPSEEIAGGNIWRTAAMIQAGMIVTALAAYFTTGIDNVKHSEIQSIMDTRAPYLHDKQRIEDRFKFLDDKNAEMESRLRELRNDFKTNDEAIVRELRSLEVQYYHENPGSSGAPGPNKPP